MTFDLRKAYAEQLKQDYLKTGFKQGFEAGFEAGYAKAMEDCEKKDESVCDTCKNIGYCEPCERMREGDENE